VSQRLIVHIFSNVSHFINIFFQKLKITLYCCIFHWFLSFVMKWEFTSRFSLTKNIIIIYLCHWEKFNSVWRVGLMFSSWRSCCEGSVEKKQLKFTINYGVLHIHFDLFLDNLCLNIYFVLQFYVVREVPKTGCFSAGILFSLNGAFHKNCILKIT
jgi:hypothetical protein